MLRVFFPPGVPGEGDIELIPAVRGGSSAYRHSAWNARYRSLFDRAAVHFVESDLEHAQVVFYPQMYSRGPETRAAMEAAQSRGLPLVFLKTGDWTDPIHISYGIVYRHSIFASRRVAGEDAMPAFCEDSLELHPGGVPIRSWNPRPSVGFCGYVGRPWRRLAYRAMGRRRKADGLALRARLLDLLAAAPDLDCHFERNDRFLGGDAGILNADAGVAQRVRAGYLDSLLGADYTLCARGAGNFSYRFYEVLSAGRIPIYVNTDSVLPYEREIDWKRHCVWVEAHEIDHIAAKIREFHARHDDASFTALQRANRVLWENYLQPVEFYRRAFTSAIEDPTSPARQAR